MKEEGLLEHVRERREVIFANTKEIAIRRDEERLRGIDTEDGKWSRKIENDAFFAGADEQFEDDEDAEEDRKYAKRQVDKRGNVV